MNIHQRYHQAIEEQRQLDAIAGVDRMEGFRPVVGVAVSPPDNRPNVISVRGLLDNPYRNDNHG